ncbi:MAG TPA: nickel-dependent hydrogenase large subunit, partial [Candidatus Limnocylindrales bacterium]
MSRVVIDPVSRVGGHLRVEVEVPGPVASDAWVSGTSFRGIERILTGRDPRDAWLLAERICGRCSGIHGLASVRAVERAFGIAIPTNARLVRNLLAATQFVVDHVLHFYQLQLADWVDLGSALRADAAATVAFARAHDIAGQPDAAYFERARDRLAALLSAGAAGSTGGRHPAYRVPPEAELIVLAHSLEALDWIRAVAHLQVLLGGKEPHPQTFLVGGMALAPAWGGPTRSAAEHPQVDHTTYPVLSARGLADVQQLIGQVQRFVREVYLPDVLLVAGYYEEW